MQEHIKMGYEFARDLHTQLITLSTGILALTITFTKEFLEEIPNSAKRLLHVAWILHITSILLGISAIMALVGNLMPVHQSTSPATITQTPATTTQSDDATPPSDTLQSDKVSQAATARKLSDEFAFNVRLFAFGQIILFVVGTFLVVWYGIIGLYAKGAHGLSPKKPGAVAYSVSVVRRKRRD